MRNKKFVNKLKIAGLILLPVMLLLLPSDFFDRGHSICLSILLFDVECYGCGMTRAIMHLIHFDFNTAWIFNKLSFIVLPLLIIYWSQLVIAAYRIVR